MRKNRSYTLGKHIDGNLYEGTLTRHNISVPVTIQKFSTVKEAADYMCLLQEFNCTNIAVAHDYSIDNSGVGGVTFLEPLKSFDSLWLCRQNKNGMWKTKGNYTLGIGEKFKSVFRGVANELEVLGKQDKVHGNLLKVGVMLDSKNKVKLLNFDLKKQNLTDSKLIKGLEKDLKDFRRLIKKAVSEDPSLSFYLPGRKSDLNAFYDLFKYKKVIKQFSSFKRIFIDPKYVNIFYLDAFISECSGDISQDGF